MGSFSIWHWLIVLLIIVLVFGTKKLKNIGADLGGAVKGFKDSIGDEDKDKEEEGDSESLSEAEEKPETTQAKDAEPEKDRS